MNRDDFRKLAGLRITEAKVLLDNACYEAAYYLSGYAVECALKACIAKKTRRFDFPDKEFACRKAESFRHLHGYC
ncbi:MAG TPA: HEPN domain-containing protein [Chloroflexia bacterium]|nr:HEPN domain-containing protein [Chloroflexia bacterium]